LPLPLLACDDCDWLAWGWLAFNADLAADVAAVAARVAAAAAAVAGGAEATLPLGGGRELLLMRDWNVVDRVAIRT